MHTGFYFFAPPPLARDSRFALPFASVRLRFLEEMTLGTGLEKRNGAISYQEPARLQLPGLNSTLPFFPFVFLIVNEMYATVKWYMKPVKYEKKKLC